MEPFRFRQVHVHITCTGKMVTVSASQITSIGYIDINGSWCADYF
jgi:hypothetical protein